MKGSPSINADRHILLKFSQVEDVKLRCFKHQLILKGDTNALVLRKHRDVFIHQVLKAGFGKIFSDKMLTKLNIFKK